MTEGAAALPRPPSEKEGSSQKHALQGASHRESWPEANHPILYIAAYKHRTRKAQHGCCVVWPQVACEGNTKPQSYAGGTDAND